MTTKSETMDSNGLCYSVSFGLRQKQIRCCYRQHAHGISTSRRKRKSNMIGSKVNNIQFQITRLHQKHLISMSGAKSIPGSSNSNCMLHSYKIKIRYLRISFQKIQLYDCFQLMKPATGVAVIQLCIIFKNISIYIIKHETPRPMICLHFDFVFFLSSTLHAFEIIYYIITHLLPQFTSSDR